MTNIEQLQKKVENIKNDLADLKSEVSVDVKKQKEKETFDKIKNTKEEINLKIDELKKLGEEKNIAEIQKLQEMLTSLDAQSQLKAEVLTDKIKPIEKQEKNPTTESQEEKKPVEEKKNRFKRQRDGFSDTTEENHGRKNTARIAGGIGIGVLAYKGIKWLFNRGEKKKEEGEKSGEEGEKKSRWKKALTWAGIGVGGALVWKNRDKIKDRVGNLFGKEDKKPEEKLSGSYEDLSEDVKIKYRGTGSDVDQYAGTNNGFAVNFSENKKDDQDKKGSILFGLDKQTKNLDEFSTNSTLDYIQDKSTDDIVDNIINWGKDKMYNCLSPYLSKLESFKGFGARFLIDPATTLKEWLKSGTPAEREKELALFYKEYMNIINYVDEKKTLLAEGLAKEEIMGKEHLNDQTTVNQEEAIHLLLDDNIWKEGRLKSFFQSHTLADLGGLSKQYNIDASSISQETKDFNDDMQHESDKMLQKDDDGSTALTRAEENFKDGSLDEDSKKELLELCGDFLEDGFGENGKSFFGAYTHLITDIFAGNTELSNNFLEKTQSKQAIEEFKSVLTGYIQKIKVGTFNKEDLQNLKQQTETYIKTKNQYELSIKKMDKMSKGLHFDAMKALCLPREAMKDIGKAFGNGKTNSWRERVGYGLGGFYLTGQTLYIGSKLIPGSSLTGAILKPIVGLSGKVGIKIGELPVSIAHEGLKLLTGRTHLTSWGWSKYLIMDATHLNKIEKEALLKNAFLRGEISQSGVMRVINKLEIATGGGNLQNFDGILKKRGLKDVKQIEIFKKYKDNKDVMKLLIKEKPNTTLGTIKKIQYTFYDRLLKSQIDFDPTSLDKLQNIDTRITGFKTNTEKQIFGSMMKHIKNLDQAEDLVIMSIDAKYLKYFKAGSDQIISAEKFGKYLGKYGKIINAEQMEKFMQFFQDAKAANKMTAANQETIVLNAFKNFNKLDAKGFSVHAIEELELNTSRYEKIAAKVKTGTNNMIKDLNELLKNPKLKTFYTGIKSKISNLMEYVKTVTPESIKAMGDTNRLDQITGFAKLSTQGVAELGKLNALIKTDKAIVKALSEAKSIEDIGGVKGVKTILKESGIAVEHIDDSILLKIAQTKNMEKIESIVNYGAEINSVNILKKIVTNPGMKAFAKWLGVVGAVTDFAFVGMDFASDMKESEKIKQTNLARGENKESEAYFDVVVGSTGAMAGLIGSVALFGAGNAWNPVGRVALGAAGVAGGAEALGDLYYGEIDKFKQNYKDFLTQSAPEIKQRLIAINSRQTELESSFQDLRSNVTGNMGAEEKRKLAPKTSGDAIKALIYVEELQKYPYAGADLNAPEVRSNPNLRTLIEQQKVLHDTAVEARYAYIKKNYIEGKTSIVTKEVIQQNHGLQSLDAILAESKIYQSSEADATYTNKIDVRGYPRYLEAELKKYNADGFAKLEKMYADNKIHFFEIIASLPYYESVLHQYGTDNESYDKLVANLDFFKKYINYRLLDVAVSDYPTVTVDKEKIDYDEITNLLSSRKITATRLTAEELASKNIEYLTDEQLNEKYDVSANLGQNILYEIAKKLKYAGKNNLADLKLFFSEKDKSIKGIYFDSGDQDWAINENNGSDNEFATDADLNNKEKIMEMRGYIYDAANSPATGNMIAGNDAANKEYGKNYIDIINQNLEYRINPMKYYKQILEYIKLNSKGKYIQLPADLLISGIKSGVSNVGAFVYRREGKKFEAKSGIKGMKSALMER